MYVQILSFHIKYLILSKFRHMSLSREGYLYSAMFSFVQADRNLGQRDSLHF